MGKPIDGGELITVVEVDRKRCARDFGGENKIVQPEAMSDTRFWDPDTWQVVAKDHTMIISDNAAANPVNGDITATRIEQNTNNFDITSKVWQTFYAKAGATYYLKLYAKRDTGDSIAYLDIDTFDPDAATPEQAQCAFGFSAGKQYASGATMVSHTDEGDGWWSAVFSFTWSDDEYIYIGLANGRDDPATYFSYPTNGSALFVYGLLLSENANAVYSPGHEWGGCDAELSADDVPEKCFRNRKTCADIPNYVEYLDPIRHAIPSEKLPKDQYIIPDVISVDVSSARLNSSSTGKNKVLGERASLNISFSDHQHSGVVFDYYHKERISGAARFDGVGYDPHDTGTFWGKWRAQNPYYLGTKIRLIEGVIPESGNFNSIAARHYVQEKFSGPDRGGRISLVCKDPLIKLDEDKAIAPARSQGWVRDGFNSTATSFYLEGTVRRRAYWEYPVSTREAWSGNIYMRINNEVIRVTHHSSDDDWSLWSVVARGELGTTPADHAIGDHAQFVLDYDNQSLDMIVRDLLLTFYGADLPREYIDEAQFANEVATYLPYGFTGYITKPEKVKDILSSLADQSGFTLHWDEYDAKIRLKALKPASAASLEINDDWIIADSLSIKERPESRLTQVWTNHGIKDYLKSKTDADNYSSTVITVIADDPYEQDVIRQVNANFLPAAAKATVEDINARLLDAYRDTHREYRFSLPYYRADQVKISDVHYVCFSGLQGIYGECFRQPVQVLSVATKGDRLDIVAEDIGRFTEIDINNRTIVYTTDTDNANARAAHDEIYAVPLSGTETITIRIDSGVLIGSASTAVPGFDVGDWPAGCTVGVVNYGYITGAGGDGSDVPPFINQTGANTVPGLPGEDAGPGLFTRKAITLDNQGTIQGGGGGGGGSGQYREAWTAWSMWGGGGAGKDAGRTTGGAGSQALGPGQQPEDGSHPAHAQDGTLTKGGKGRSKSHTYGGKGGKGGDAGQAGQAGDTVYDHNNQPIPGGAGGAAGAAIDGASFITFTATGTITGPQVN